MLFSKINAVIASQCAHWRGNPPVEWDQVAITAKNRNSPRFSGAIRYIFPLTGGLPHQESGLVRNDRKLEGEAAKQQFSCPMISESKLFI